MGTVPGPNFGAVPEKSEARLNRDETASRYIFSKTVDEWKILDWFIQC